MGHAHAMLVIDEQRLETSEITCQFTAGTLEPGRTRRIRYVLIPVIPNVALTPVSIGEQLRFSYESVGRQYQAQADRPRGGIVGDSRGGAPRVGLCHCHERRNRLRVHGPCRHKSSVRRTCGACRGAQRRLRRFDPV